MTFPFLMLALGAAATGAAYSGAERNVRAEIPRIEATVEVDGHLSEPMATGGTAHQLLAVCAR